MESFTPVKNTVSKLENENWKGIKTARVGNEGAKGFGMFEKSGRNQNVTPEIKRIQKT